MHLHVVSDHPCAESDSGLVQALNSLGHPTRHSVLSASSVPGAADLGHQLAGCWADDQPDAVLALGWLAGLSAQVGTRDLATPVLQRLFAPGRSPAPERRRLESAVGRGAARVLAVCSSDADRLVALGVRRSLVRVVPHAVDTQVFRDEGRASAGGPWHRLVARPVDAAAARRLISVVASLPRCELVLLTTTATRGGLTSALPVTPGKPSAQGRVRLLDLEQQGAPAVAALLGSTDVVVAVDDDEPSLVLVLQAMACGVPAVAASVGALADVVADGVTGVLVPPTSAEGLAESLRGLLADGLSRESQALAAVDRVQASFGWATVAPAVLRVAEEVVADDRLLPVASAAAP
jgi:glycosyltransferase involved in cell wall biosynthesis